MTWLFVGGIVLLFIVALFFFLIFPARPTAEQRTRFGGVNYAHRGLHTADCAVPENSLAAFAAAAEAGYGIELDLQFSKDEQIVVFHDDTLQRVCGVERRVDEYTYAELCEFHLCRTGEKIPLFSEVLACVNGRVPLLVELKNGPKNRLLCERSYAMLKKYKGDYCVESFQPVIVRWFKKNAPQVLRGQLSSPARDMRGEIGGPAAFLLGNLLTNVLARPQFIAYSLTAKSFSVRIAQRLGGMRFCWTSRDGTKASEREQENDSVIFEYYHPEARFRS